MKGIIAGIAAGIAGAALWAIIAAAPPGMKLAGWHGVSEPPLAPASHGEPKAALSPEQSPS